MDSITTYSLRSKLNRELELFRHKEEAYIAIKNKTRQQISELDAVRTKIRTILFKLDNLNNGQPLLGDSTGIITNTPPPRINS